MSFNPGDKVLIGGNLLAEIVVYDEQSNSLVYKHTPAGGGSDTVYAHVSNTRVEALPGAVAAPEPAAEAEAVEAEAVEAEAVEAEDVEAAEADE